MVSSRKVGTEAVGLEQEVRSRRVLRFLRGARGRAGPRGWDGRRPTAPDLRAPRRSSSASRSRPRWYHMTKSSAEASSSSRRGRTEDRSRGWVADRQPAVLQQIEPGLPDRRRRPRTDAAGRPAQRPPRPRARPTRTAGEQVCGQFEASASPSAASSSARGTSFSTASFTAARAESHEPCRLGVDLEQAERLGPLPGLAAGREVLEAAYVPGPPGSRCRHRPGQPLLPPLSARTGAPLEELAADESVGGVWTSPRPSPSSAAIQRRSSPGTSMKKSAACRNLAG